MDQSTPVQRASSRQGPPLSHYWDAVARRAVSYYKAQHDPLELAGLLAILHSRQPKIIVEVGAWAGGSAWAWTQLPSVTAVWTIDIAPQAPVYVMDTNPDSQVHLITGDSTHESTLDVLAFSLGHLTADVVVIDGGHDYQTARHDYWAYQAFAQPDGLVVVHDTQGYPGRPDIEVPRLWAEIRTERPTLELVTNPGGPFGTGLVWLGDGNA